MGIDVVNRSVSYNPAHHYGLNHSPAFNPTTRLLKKTPVSVTSIFQRRKLQEKEGDGNPFIYALKNKNGYKISRIELCKFKPDFCTILDVAMQNRASPLLVPMPSSHGIAKTLAMRAQRACPSATIDFGLFQKKTAGDVANDLSLLLPSLSDEKLLYAAKRLISELSKTPNGVFSMKEIDFSRLRTHIVPLRLVKPIPQGVSEIILVDDLLSSGSTLRGAYNELLKAGSALPISGLCLLGALS